MFCYEKVWLPQDSSVTTSKFKVSNDLIYVINKLVILISRQRNEGRHEYTPYKK